MKTAIIYASVHHNNTYKIVKALSETFDIDLFDATKDNQVDLSNYDLIGFASGIYYSKFHSSILKFAQDNLPEGKEVFYLCTYGGKAVYKSIDEVVLSKKATHIGSFGCAGYDTFGPFKLVGGVKKGHPNDEDIKNAIKFFANITAIYS